MADQTHAACEIRVVDRAAAIPPEVWDRLCPPGHPFLNRDFLSIVEAHGAAGPRWGWRACHLVALAPDPVRSGDEEIVGVLPLYLKGNGFGDFTRDWSWAGAWRQLGREYFPKLSSGLPHTPVAGPRLLAVPGASSVAIRRALIAGAKQLLADNGWSSWHIALPAADDADALLAEGLVESCDVQFHWHDRGFGDFDGYLASFTAEKRRKVRAERRRVAESGFEIEARHGNEIEPAEWPALHALYAATFEKFNNHAVFTSDCFADLAAALGPRMVVFIARDRREPVAVSLCFRSAEALYGRYWGCRDHYDSLHFELCFYRGIDYCLREGLVRFEPGAGGEHKIARGFAPCLVPSLHWIAEPAMRALVTAHLERERGLIAEYRDEAALHLPFRQGGEGCPDYQLSSPPKSPESQSSPLPASKLP